ncbi:MAG: hypothetical protein IJF73_01690, partial [Clostridia bacterium]|nr:hypothetical protein [Clostridia bacterium]
MTEQEIYQSTIGERYHPAEAVRRMVLDSGRGHSLRFATRTPPRLELNITFERRQDASLLYEIEDDLCRLCEAHSFRIFPHYPPGEFSVAVMGEIFAEAAKIGAVVNGFFYEATSTDDGETVTVEIPFLQSGVDMVAKTGALLSAILQNRYNVRRRVVIVPAENAAARRNERLLAREAEDRRRLEEQVRLGAEAEQRRRETLSPTENPEYSHALSLSGAEAAVERPSESVVSIGSLRLDVSSPEAVLGRPFSPDGAIPLAKAQRSEGAVTVLGEVFSTELRESHSGDRITVQIGITDGSSSIYLRRGFD